MALRNLPQFLGFQPTNPIDAITNSLLGSTPNDPKALNMNPVVPPPPVQAVPPPLVPVVAPAGPQILPLPPSSNAAAPGVVMPTIDTRNTLYDKGAPGDMAINHPVHVPQMTFAQQSGLDVQRAQNEINTPQKQLFSQLAGYHQQVVKDPNATPQARQNSLDVLRALVAPSYNPFNGAIAAQVGGVPAGTTAATYGGNN